MASKATISTVSDENSVTDQNLTVTDISGVQSTINQSNGKFYTLELIFYLWRKLEFEIFI